jgi:hypothetical protein
MTSTPLRNSCRRVVGRLIEIRHDAGYQMQADMDALMARMKLLLVGRSVDTPVIVVADWRLCKQLVLATELADGILGVMNLANPCLLRSANLLRADMPTAFLQVMRLVSEAQLKVRRIFSSPNDLSEWLREITTAEEQARLALFLARGNLAA